MRELVAFLMFGIFVGACSFATRENARTIPVRMYGDGPIVRAQMAWNGSGRGEFWFNSRDGEQFVGEYTTIAPEVYHQDLSFFITRIGRTPFVSSRQGFGSVTSNVQYGLGSAAGDRGTMVVCKYIATVSQWTWGFSATGTCLDSKGKSYTLHTSSDDTESPSLKAAELRTPVAGSDATESESNSKPPTLPEQSEKFAAFLGSKPIKETPPPPASPEPQQPVVIPKQKFYGNLTIYAGRIVPLGGGSAGNTRAEFEEESPGSGTVRIIEPGNNVFDGSFTTKKPGESGIFSIITQKTLQQLNVSKAEGLGMISATDAYGAILECVYGTMPLSKRKTGLCEDSRGNKYRLHFD